MRPVNQSNSVIPANCVHWHRLQIIYTKVIQILKIQVKYNAVVVEDIITVLVS